MPNTRKLAASVAKRVENKAEEEEKVKTVTIRKEKERDKI